MNMVSYLESALGKNEILNTLAPYMTRGFRLHRCDHMMQSAPSVTAWLMPATMDIRFAEVFHIQKWQEYKTGLSCASKSWTTFAREKARQIPKILWLDLGRDVLWWGSPYRIHYSCQQIHEEIGSLKAEKAQAQAIDQAKWGKLGNLRHIPTGEINADGFLRFPFSSISISFPKIQNLIGDSVKGFIFLNGPWFKFGKSRKLACYSNTQFLFAEAPSLTGNQWLLVISHSGIKSDGLGPQASQQEEIDQLQKDLSIRRKMMEEMVMSHWVA